MIEILISLARSSIFLWSAVAVTALILVAAWTIKKHHTIPLGDKAEPIAWPKRCASLAVIIVIFLLIIGGLVMLVHPSTTPQQILPKEQRPIDAIYLLDFSGSMSASAFPGNTNCADDYRVTSIENGSARKDCTAITLLDKLLLRNPGANILVIIFGGTDVIIGPSAERESLLNAVWLNWKLSQSLSFTGATDIKQALGKAIMFSSQEKGFSQNRIPVIIASDFEDDEPPALMQLLAALVNKKFNLVAFVMENEGYNSSVDQLKNILGEASVFIISDVEALDTTSLNLDLQKPNTEISASGVASPEVGLSLRIVLGAAMLIAALTTGVIFMRPVRWPKGE